MRALDIPMQEARQILSDHGLLAVRRALDEAKGPDTLWSALLGYTIEGTPAAVGGGGVVQDSAMYMDFQLRNPVTREAVESEHVTLTIVRQPNNVLDILVVPFDPARGCYSLDLRGMDLDPGAYDLYLDFGNGTSQQLLSLYVPALG
jgi:hypothetical protein